MFSYDKLYFQYKKFYATYLEKLIPILNNYHKINRTKQYWEPIVGLYLRKLIFNYFFLQRIVSKKRFFKKANINNFNLYYNFVEFQDHSDFKKINERYFLRTKNIKVYKNYKLNKKSYIFTISNFLRIIFPYFLIKLGITRFFYQESYFKKFLRVIIYFKSFFYFSSLPFLRFKKFELDKKKIFENRLSLIKKYESKNITDPLMQNIIFFMPVNYVENFDVILEEVKKIPISDGLYVDGNEVKFDYVKIYIAELIFNKKKIFIGQHSLRIGLENFDIYSDYSKSTSDYFLTWGWKDKINSIVKFSSLRIFSSLKKYKKIQLKKIIGDLNVCYILPAYSTMGYCFSDNYKENKKAEQERINLLKKIKKQKDCKITLKPRDSSFIINDQKKFYNNFEILKKKTRMYKIFGNYNIIIFERISLGIAESISLNQPTIFYYSKNLYKQKNKKYNELLSILKKANIYFDDKNKILKILSSKQNISLWWNNKNNIKNRKVFIQRFAKCFTYNDLSKIKKLI